MINAQQDSTALPPINAGMPARVTQPARKMSSVMAFVTMMPTALGVVCVSMGAATTPVGAALSCRTPTFVAVSLDAGTCNCTGLLPLPSSSSDGNDRPV